VTEIFYSMEGGVAWCARVCIYKGRRKEEGVRGSVGSAALHLGLKTDMIRMNMTGIIFVFVFLVGFGFKYR